MAGKLFLPPVITPIHPSPPPPSRVALEDRLLCGGSGPWTHSTLRSGSLAVRLREEASDSRVEQLMREVERGGDGAVTSLLQLSPRSKLSGFTNDLCHMSLWKRTSLPSTKDLGEDVDVSNRRGGVEDDGREGGCSRYGDGVNGLAEGKGLKGCWRLQGRPSLQSQQVQITDTYCWCP